MSRRGLDRWRDFGVLIAVMLLCVGVVAATAGQREPAPACATLLTAAELRAIVGEGMQDMGPQQREPGESLCAWMARGGQRGFRTVAVTYYEPAALAGSPKTLDALYEDIVSGAEGVAAGARVRLNGIGVRADFVPTDPQVLVAVQLTGGVARIVANNLTRAEITAVARAVAAP